MTASADKGIVAGARERRRIRTEGFSGTTAGLAPGNVQANLVILPQALAHDFLLRFPLKRMISTFGKQ